MAAIKAALGGTTVITCTLTSVANYAAREAAFVDNHTNLYLDALLMAKIQVSAVPIGDLYALLDTSIDGTNFDFPGLGTDNGTLFPSGVPPQVDKLGGEQPGQQHAGTNLKFFSRINAAGGALTATGVLVCTFGSIAAALGGNLTYAWGPVFINCTGAALGATAGSHVIWYDGISATSI